MRLGRTLGRTLGLVVTAAALAVSSAASAHADEPVPEPTPAPTEEPVPPPVIIVEAEPPAPPPPGPTFTPTPRKRNIGLAGRFHAGLGQRNLYGDSALGADVCGSLGAYTESFNLYVNLQMLFASSDGLPVRQYRFGPSIDFEAFSRVRLGVGISLGGTTITRETNTKTMQAFSAGARLYASVDVWKLGDRGAFYVLAQLSVDSAGALFPSKTRGSVPATALWGPTLAAGFRF